MLEIAPLALLTAAAAVWLFSQRPPASPLAFAGAPVTGDDPTPEPESQRPAWHDLLMAKKGGGGSAPDPDPNIGKAALKNAELGQDWLSFAKGQFRESNQRQDRLDRLTERVTESQLEAQDQATEWAAEDRARWEEKFLPLQDEYIEEASNWGSEANQEAAAAEAKADVVSTAGQQRQASQRQMASMGIDPRSGRYAGVDRAAERDTALAAAGAQNNARNRVEREGMTMKADALNVGAGLPAQAASGASLGLNAGNSALGNQTSANQMFNSNAGIMSQGFQGAMSGNSSMAGILNQQYGSQLNAWSAQQQAEAQGAAGLMSGLGTLGGAAIMASSKDFKEDKRPVEGSAVDTLQQMPVERWRYKDDSPGADGGREHVGPYAEDYRDATGQGDGKTIPLQDMSGLHTKAIQELGMRVAQLEGGGKSRRGETYEGEYEETQS